MFFDIKSQVKLAQNLTEFTLRNMNDAMNKAAPSGATSDKNPMQAMMNPAAWLEEMMANAPSAATPNGPSLWWPLNPEFLSMLQPPAPTTGNMGIPNMAIPLGLTPFGLSPFGSNPGASPFGPSPGTSPFGSNPFGAGQSDTTPSMPMFSTTSPFTGDQTPELPNMFWWLVQPEQADPTDEADETAAEESGAAPWAMVMDPFGLLTHIEPQAEPEPEAEEEQSDNEDFNPFHMMFDPFGLLKDQNPEHKTKTKAKAKKTKDTPAPTALDFFDPLGLMKPRSDKGETSGTDKSRGAFVGFEPGAKHPLMNDGRPTGMFYVAVALPPEIDNINPHIPGWNLAF